MYSWSGDTSGWYGDKKYSYGSRGADKRKEAEDRARESGPRTYDRRGMPDTQRTTPKKRLRAHGPTPMIVAVDVTGSMASWPFEIFDRLPLLFNTLSQYRDDLEISFMAVGDVHADKWPLQVTNFAGGFDLETQLKALYGEGGGGDIPESYGALAWYIHNRVEIPNAKGRPFLIVFGDAPMHPRIPRQVMKELTDADPGGEVDALAEWQAVAKSWDVWFLRRPTGRPGDEVDQQWKKALGSSRVVQIEDEQRAVDCAMGIAARAWGFLDNFKENMAARQNTATVDQVTDWITRFGVKALSCPQCKGAIPKEAFGRFTCAYCGSTLEV